jgi:hypothetical protein
MSAEGGRPRSGGGAGPQAIHSRDGLPTPLRPVQLSSGGAREMLEKIDRALAGGHVGATLASRLSNSRGTFGCPPKSPRRLLDTCRISPASIAGMRCSFTFAPSCRLSLTRPRACARAQDCRGPACRDFRDFPDPPGPSRSKSVTSITSRSARVSAGLRCVCALLRRRSASASLRSAARATNVPSWRTGRQVPVNRG